ncbi:MAG: TIGR04283 family arsenosugar biosynthesis glycosyltransferase [Bacteroidetes bacterium]|nr:TIGR04283 family arsenosugar biosynthesis glycosyltransferase [Bacteroidota bacterium]
MEERISVIVPSLNEEALIGGTLRSIRAEAPDIEVVVVDGGSTDRSPEIAGEYARVISAPRGRAVQMNKGAQHSSGDVLVFLHADTRIPPGYFSALRDAISMNGMVGGYSPMDFDASSTLLDFFSRLTRKKCWLFHYGDQAFFVRRKIFEELGGYAEIPIMEDLDILMRLRKKGALALLPVPVTSSARRFLAGGVIRAQARNILLVLLYLLGVRPGLLKRLYPDNRT